jgi:hypothetical protein
MNQGLLGWPVGTDRMLRIAKREYILVRDERAAGTSAGDPATSVWETRVLNTIVHDDTGVVRLAANQIMVPAGNYRARVRGLSMNGSTSKVRLRDVTAGVTVASGGSHYHDAGGDGSYVVYQLIARGDFTLTRDQTLLELQQWWLGTGGGGWTRGIGTFGNSFKEIYGTVELWRLGS